MEFKIPKKLKNLTKNISNTTSKQTCNFNGLAIMRIIMHLVNSGLKHYQAKPYKLNTN